MEMVSIHQEKEGKKEAEIITGKEAWIRADPVHPSSPPPPHPLTPSPSPSPPHSLEGFDQSETTNFAYALCNEG